MERTQDSKYPEVLVSQEFYDAAIALLKAASQPTADRPQRIAQAGRRMDRIVMQDYGDPQHVEIAFLQRIKELERAYKGASFYDTPNRKIAISKAQQEFRLSDERVEQLCYA